jgi:UDP-N-acetyl-2-amino-2-deoxyglucuronate dehydrogenase
MGAYGYGIIGCGWVAAAHAWGVRSLADDARLVAIADIDTTRAHELAARFDVPVVTGDYQQLLARDDISAVSICLPDFLHHEVTLAAADAGKHVLCEKPLSLDLRQADEMLAACERRGVQLGLIMNHRYAPDNIRARWAIEAGALGRLLIGNVLHSSGLTGDPSGASPWRGRRGRATGGVLSTQAIHFLDLLLWLGGPARSVKAWSDQLTAADQDHEDTVALALQLQSGALATLVATSGSPIMDDFTGTRIELHGTDGYLMLEGDRLRITELASGHHLGTPTLAPVPDGAEEIIFGTGHVQEVADFVRALRMGAPAPVPGADGRHLMAVIAAAYRSAREDRDGPVDEPTAAYAATAHPTSVLMHKG